MANATGATAIGVIGNLNMAKPKDSKKQDKKQATLVAQPLVDQQQDI